MFLQDLFYSFQGEGILVGYPQIFIRFFGCNIKCDYCDEPDRNKTPKTTAQLMTDLQPLLTKKPHSISFTGGEPLLQVDAISELIPLLKPYGIPFFLETNGMFPDRLAKIMDDFTYFSIDYKPGHTAQFAEFVRLVKDRPGTYVKYVTLKDFPSQDVEDMAHTIATLNPNIPLILQPVTPFGLVTETPTHADLERAYELARHHVPDVRIIAQTHKFMGLK